MQASRSLTVIIPISRMFGRLNELRKTLTRTYDLDVILVHDVKDQFTSPELHQMIIEIDNPAIKILEGEFGSPGAARNAGLEIVDTEWVTFWDSDDIACHHKYVETIRNKTKEIDIIVCQYNVNFTSASNTKIATTNSMSLEDLAIELGLWRMIFRRSHIGETRFTNLLMGEDQLFFLEILEKEPRIDFSTEIVYSYSVGNNSQLTSDPFALSQLDSVIKSLMQNNRENSSRLRTFKRILILRQLISALSSRYVKGKFHLLRIFLLKVLKKREIFEYFQAALTIYSKLTYRKYKSNCTTVLNGGLGNQLFQLAFSLAQSEDRITLNANIGKVPSNSKNGLPDISHFWLPTRVRLEWLKRNGIFSKKFGNLLLINEISPNIFLRQLNRNIAVGLNMTLTILFFKHKMRIRIFNGKDKRSSDRNYLNFGYFQTSEWAKLPYVYEELSKIHAKQISTSTNLLIKEAEKVFPIIMHLRFGDYLLESNFGNLSANYYQKCLDELSTTLPNSPIWVFSDDKSKSTDLLKQMRNPKYRYIDTDAMNSAEILELMRHGAAFIIANSSFSWWGAFLRDNVFAPVIAPTPWFKNIDTSENLIPREWLVRSADWI